MATLARLLEPGGTLFVSTLNRTPRSYLAAEVDAGVNYIAMAEGRRV